MTVKNPRKSVATPQFRSLLIRKMNNLEPSYELEFLNADRGLAFRMKDSNGRYRSKVINIYVDNNNTLTTDNLRRLLQNAEFPAKFQ